VGKMCVCVGGGGGIRVNCVRWRGLSRQDVGGY
jgi:hypothetical protein